LNPSAAGQAVTFTATVTGSAPTGNVAFTADGTALSGCGAVTLPTGSANAKRAAPCGTPSIPGANPSVATLDRALRATGHRLELAAPRWRSSVDETLLRQALRLRPAERLASFEHLQREGRALAAAGARGRMRPADG